MKRVISTIGLSVLTIISVCAYAADGQSFTSKEFGFSMRFPPNWEKKEKLGDTAVAFIAPKGVGTDAFRSSINVVVQEIPSDADLAKFSTGALAVMDKLLKSYKQLARQEVTLGSVKALRVVYIYSYEDSEQKELYDLKAYVVFAVTGKHAYAITCTAPAPSFEAHKQAFDESVASFNP